MADSRTNTKLTPNSAFAVTIAGLLVGVTWSYWPVLSEMASKWSSDPQYSHGYLVPLFSLFLVGRAWKLSGPWPFERNWWGLSFLALGITLRLVGAWYFFDWIQAISLLPMLAGAALLLSGWRALKELWPAILFLGFMIPLPFRIEHGLSHPLQRLATIGSTYILQTLGREAFNEGNVIVINDARIGVVEACNGLGMFLLFFAMAAAVAILVRRPLWEKLFIFASAAPIAVAVNIVRITVTAIVHELAGSKWADLIFHDLAGWLMMPLALLALAIELGLLSRLFIEVQPVARRPVAQISVAPNGPTIVSEKRMSRSRAR